MTAGEAIVILLSLVTYAWPYVAATASVLFTAVHAADEVAGEGGPLWREFGRIAGVRVPDTIGFIAVACLLPVALIFAAAGGYLGGNVACLSALYGARMGDFVFSHWLLWLTGWSRPNPGLISSLLYAVEVPLLVATGPPLSPAIVTGSALSFAVTIPLLWLCGRFAGGDGHG